MKTFLKIPQKIHYALLLVTDLAEQQRLGQVVSLKDVSDRQGVSRGFLEEVAAFLRKSGIISGKRGRGGGYVLMKNPEELTIGEIITAVEGPIAMMKCLDSESDCFLAPMCPSRGAWQKVQSRMVKTLSDISVADVLTGSPAGS